MTSTYVRLWSSAVSTHRDTENRTCLRPLNPYYVGLNYDVGAHGLSVVVHSGEGNPLLIQQFLYKKYI